MTKFLCHTTLYHDRSLVFQKGKYYFGDLCKGTTVEVFFFDNCERDMPFMLQSQNPDEDHYLQNNLRQIMFTFGR